MPGRRKNTSDEPVIGRARPADCQRPSQRRRGRRECVCMGALPAAGSCGAVHDRFLRPEAALVAVGGPDQGAAGDDVHGGDTRRRCCILGARLVPRRIERHDEWAGPLRAAEAVATHGHVIWRNRSRHGGVPRHVPVQCWAGGEGARLVDGASHVLGVLWSKRASRQMLIFLSVNVAFMFVELGVGLYTNSLGLMGDAGHMLFDNGALVIGLAASYIGQLPPDAKFTYGYGRVEVLSGFLNSLLLLVVSFHLLTEAASRFLDPPEVATDHLLLTSTAGLVVNLVGLFFFHDHVHHGHSHSEHSGGCGSGHGHSHGNTHHQAHGEDASEDGHHGGNSNMYGVYLHVLADTLGSVGVIISSILIQLYEWHVADSASSALISLLILGSTLPLLRDTARQLLQGAPQDREANVNAALQEVQASIPGVERVAQWNIWHHAGDMCVATLHLEISTSANEQQVLQQTRTIFRRHARLDKFLSVQISKPQELSAMGLDGVGAEQSMVMNDCSAGHSHSHGHGHGHGGHGHGHGVDSMLELHPGFSSQQQYGYRQQPTSATMSTHENPVSDDSRYVTLPDLPVKQHTGHGHGLQYHSPPVLAPPPAPFQQRRQQINSSDYSAAQPSSKMSDDRAASRSFSDASPSLLLVDTRASQSLEPIRLPAKLRDRIERAQRRANAAKEGVSIFAKESKDSAMAGQPGPAGGRSTTAPAAETTTAATLGDIADPHRASTANGGPDDKMHLPDVVLSHKMRDFEARANTGGGVALFSVEPADRSLQRLSLEDRERVMLVMQRKIQQISSEVDENFARITKALDANGIFDSAANIQRAQTLCLVDLQRRIQVKALLACRPTSSVNC
ncbi:hypothetical protein ON010_g10592 [Phytophthora cinnamomi]|nr:hypothetical protein ON010_g10592 [Phytophthora cinnamomi]